MGGVLCALCRCGLGIDNLDALVMIYENWPNDSRMDVFTLEVVYLSTSRTKLNF